VSMIRHLESEFLFDPVYELHDCYKLSMDTGVMYGLKPGRVTRMDLDRTATDAALTVWLTLYDIIKKVEEQGDAN